MTFKRKLVVVCIIMALGLIGVFFRIHTDQSSSVVSMVNLIANPRAYNGKYIIVQGFLGADTVEGSLVLFLTRDHLDAYDTSNALYLYLVAGESINEQMPFVGKHVYVRGYFDGNNKGHYGIFAGCIKSAYIEYRGRPESDKE